MADHQAAHAGAWPDMVEVFISRSPCSRSPADTANGVNYPVGCGAKLQTLIATYPLVTQWRILFDEVFKGSRTGAVHDANAIIEAHGAIAELNALANVEARKINVFLDR